MSKSTINNNNLRDRCCGLSIEGGTLTTAPQNITGNGGGNFRCFKCLQPAFVVYRKVETGDPMLAA